MSLGFGAGSPSSLVGALKKAKLVARDNGAQVDSLTFTYNPTEVSTSKSATWRRPTTNAATTASQPQFTGPQPQSVEMEIFFDAWSDPLGDVSQDVKKILSWTRPTSGSRNRQSPSPPLISVEWGSSRALSDFRGYLKQVTAKYLSFRADGVPIRATCKITLEEVPEEPAGQNPTSGALESRRTRLLGDGDSLASIAYSEYGQASLWRALARFNGIDDPFAVSAGTRLLVPSLAEATRLAGVEEG